MRIVTKMSIINYSFFFVLSFTLLFIANSQIIPPLARCADLSDNSTCLLTQVKVSKSNPNFRIQSPNPLEVRSTFINDSVVPVLTGNICKKFVNLRSLVAIRILIEDILEDAFKDCRNLISLDLSGNQIKHISNVLFQNTVQLKYFYVESNFLKYIPDGLFSSISTLSAFSINHNRLKEVPINALSNQRELIILGIHSNDILNFNEDTINKMFPNLQTIEFNNNKLSCDRQFDIQEYFAENNVSTPYTALPRYRYHQINQIGSVFCVGDVDWTGLYYKRVAEGEEIEQLKVQVDNLEHQLESTLQVVEKLLRKI